MENVLFDMLLGVIGLTVLIAACTQIGRKLSVKISGPLAISLMFIGLITFAFGMYSKLFLGHQYSVLLLTLAFSPLYAGLGFRIGHNIRSQK